MGKSKEKKVKEVKLSKKELKAQAKALKKSAKKNDKQEQPVKEPKAKKSKKDKKPKLSIDKLNIFTMLGLDEKHRAKPFQLTRHMDEVSVVRNKTQFPYIAEVMQGSLCAVVINEVGRVAFSRTGAQLQNMGALLDKFKAKAGVYICELYVSKSVTTPEKLAAMVSPFRANKLTAPQQKIVDNELQLSVTDYLTIEEFTVGKAERLYSGRMSRMNDILAAGLGENIHQAKTKKVKSQEALEKFLKKSVKKGAAGITIKGENPYVCGHQNFHFMSVVPYVKYNLECTGYREGINAGKGKIGILEFKYKDGMIVEAPLGTEYDDDAAAKMLDICKSKKKKGAPMGFVFNVYALEESTSGVLKNPKVGSFTKEKADYKST